jgi:shikimate kinase
MRDKIILTGFMATGKSAVARILARRLGWRLCDSDRELSARAGKSIAAIFDEDGEAHFRRLEREAIAQLVADPNPAVIATGGGALVDDENYRVLAKAGVIVCLSARPEVIAKRVGRSSQPRPKLVAAGKPLDEAIAELLAARQAAYAKAAITVDTSDISTEESADRVLEALAAQGLTFRTVNRCEPSA